MGNNYDPDKHPWAVYKPPLRGRMQEGGSRTAPTEHAQSFGQDRPPRQKNWSHTPPARSFPRLPCFGTDRKFALVSGIESSMIF
jgi:hypothetical protein